MIPKFISLRCVLRSRPLLNNSTWMFPGQLSHQISKFLYLQLQTHMIQTKKLTLRSGQGSRPAIGSAAERLTMCHIWGGHICGTAQT